MNTFDARLKSGLSSAISLSVLTALTWGFAMTAIPASAPYCTGDCVTYPFSETQKYYPRDYYWMFVAVFQLCTFIIFIVSNHLIAPPEKKRFSGLSVAFAFISSTILFVAYFTKFSVVPGSMMKGEMKAVHLITQHNDHGFFVALEELGYITMSISLFFLAFTFPVENLLGKAIRAILFFSFFFTLAAFVFYLIKYGIDRSYRFEVTAIAVNWLALISLGILTGMFFGKKLKKQS